MASPLLLNKTQTQDSTKLTNDYIRNSSYLIALAGAVGQLVMIGNRVTELAGLLALSMNKCLNFVCLGFTSRVSELLEMVKHLQHVGNEPFQIIETPRPPEEEREEYKSTQAQKEWLVTWKDRRNKWKEEQFFKTYKLSRRMSSSRISFEAPQIKVNHWRFLLLNEDAF